MGGGATAGGFERDQQLKFRWHRRLLLALTLLVPTWGSVFAENPKTPAPPTDPDLLEFLGGVDSGAESQAEDGSWIDYLAQTDIGKVAKTSDPNNGAPRPKPPAAGTQPPAPGDKNDQ